MHMEPPSTRRQNHSCDQCRHSKRRCVPAEDEEGASDICRNCKHLSYPCTYNFVKSRAARKTRNKASLSSAKEVDLIGDSGREEGNDVPPISNTTGWLDSFTSAVEGLGDDLFWASNESPDSNDLKWFNSEPNVRPLQWKSSKALSMNQNQDNSSNPITTNTSTSSAVAVSSFATTGLSEYGPTALLNSTFTLNLAGQYFSSIHDAVITAMATRYLSYHSNAFAGPVSYKLESEKEVQKHLTWNDQAGDRQESTSDDRSSTTDTSPEAQLQDTSNKIVSSRNFALTRQPLADLETQNIVTLIGVCQFLDHFGPLFGNVQSRAAMEGERLVLGSVVQAFALQSTLVPSISTASARSQIPKTNVSDSTQLFKDAWFYARSLLIESIDTISYTHLYSVFLFHMIAVPEEAKGEDSRYTGPNQLLDHALLQLLDLEKLVNRYCTLLKGKSRYKVLLQSSLAILRWYGYVRDTAASLSSDRQCVLDDATIGPVDSQVVPPPSTTYEPGLVTKMCQCGAAGVFFLYRKVINNKRLLEHPPLDLGELLRSGIDSATELIDSFSKLYKSWFDSCIAHFDEISTDQKLSFAFLILFWNHGVLYIVEQMKQHSVLTQNEHPYGMESNWRELRRSALSRLGTISGHIMRASEDRDVPLLEGADVELPFVSHHANTELVVMALQKAIEHVIDVKTADDGMSEPVITNTDDGSCLTSLKPLLWCLVSLDRTNSGRCTARPVIHRLINEHGDILMDCWTPYD